MVPSPGTLTVNDKGVNAFRSVGTLPVADVYAEARASILETNHTQPWGCISYKVSVDLVRDLNMSDRGVPLRIRRKPSLVSFFGGRKRDES